jgi:hypothetical protein
MQPKVWVWNLMGTGHLVKLQQVCGGGFKHRLVALGIDTYVAQLISVPQQGLARLRVECQTFLHGPHRHSHHIHPVECQVKSRQQILVKYFLADTCAICLSTLQVKKIEIV